MSKNMREKLVKYNILQYSLKIFTGNNFCGLEPETGVCDAYFPSYFYNMTSRRCERFIYGGCGGNDNRFLTLEQCQATCG